MHINFIKQIIFISLLFSSHCLFAQVGRFYTYTPSTYQSVFVPFPIEEMKLARDARNANGERLAAIEFRKTKASIDQLNAYYNSLSNFPLSIPDGWYNTVATNNYDFIANRYVLVKDGIITQYMLDDNSTRVPIFSAYKISNAKGLIQLTETNDYLSIYFLDFLNKK